MRDYWRVVHERAAQRSITIGEARRQLTDEAARARRERAAHLARVYGIRGGR
jgi:hypothetical protein